MAYNVNFTPPARALGRADLTFEVYENNAKLGELRVSKGGVEFVHSNRQNGKKVTWKHVAELLS